MLSSDGHGRRQPASVSGVALGGRSACVNCTGGFFAMGVHKGTRPQELPCHTENGSPKSVCHHREGLADFAARPSGVAGRGCGGTEGWSETQALEVVEGTGFEPV